MSQINNDPVYKIPLYSVANFSLPFGIWSAYWVIIQFKQRKSDLRPPVLVACQRHTS